MEAYPETILPLPSVNFNVDVVYSNVRTKMDSGRLRQRPRFTRELSTAAVIFEMNRLEYAAFRHFWDVRLTRGTDWFTMRLPIPDTNILTSCQVRFISDCRENHRANGNWDVTATIEFFETDGISAVVFELLTLEGSDLTNFFLWTNNLTEEVTNFEADHSFNLP